ncbi:MAG: hypothetical protein COB46_04245 [Rhodospirillaceae bacterium]|nr:MAG: hypothetical protein COB46_04245 [Rhodospirillaceae bacterium]
MVTSNPKAALAVMQEMALKITTFVDKHKDTIAKNALAEKITANYIFAHNPLVLVVSKRAGRLTALRQKNRIFEKLLRLIYHTKPCSAMYWRLNSLLILEGCQRSKKNPSIM